MLTLSYHVFVCGHNLCGYLKGNEVDLYGTYHSRAKFWDSELRYECEVSRHFVVSTCKPRTTEGKRALMADCGQYSPLTYKFLDHQRHKKAELEEPVVHTVAVSVAAKVTNLS